jgi:DDE superfamily endonuclease
MAARVDPRHVRARHQSMHHFIANATWDDAAILRVARETVLAALARHGPVAAWVVDDTGIPKKGRHSVGVARQYCGVLGKQDNCQVAVSVSVAHERASMPVAYRLYLPEAWASDRRRRRRAGVPDPVEFHAKWQIALEQIAQLTAERVPAAPVVADAGYGVVTAFRDALTAQGIPYLVGISTETTVWAPGRAPLPVLRQNPAGGKWLISKPDPETIPARDHPSAPPTLLGFPIPDMGRVAPGPHHRDPRHRASLAPAPFSRLLDHALAESQGWPPVDQRRDRCSRPQDGRRETAMGCAPNPGRVEGWRGTSSGPSPAPATSNGANGFPVGRFPATPARMRSPGGPYSFSPDRAIPRTKARWKNRKMIAVGIMPMTAMAMISW